MAGLNAQVLAWWRPANPGNQNQLPNQPDSSLSMPECELSGQRGSAPFCPAADPGHQGKGGSSFFMRTGRTWAKKQSSGGAALSQLLPCSPSLCTPTWSLARGSEEQPLEGAADRQRGDQVSGLRGTSFLQISISTMSDRSWTRVVATESREAVLWPLLHLRRLSGSGVRQAEALSGGPSVWVLPSLLPCFV